VQTNITSLGTVTAGTLSTGLTINAANVTWSGQIPGVSVATVANASGSPSATFGVMKCDGITITCASGVATAVGASATSVTVGTTTIVSGTGNGPLTNNSAVLGNVLWGQLPGIAGNTPASAGNVGEVISSNIAQASAVSLSNGTGASVTSITLTAGDWDVSGVVWFNGGTSTSITALFSAISSTNNTLPTDASLDQSVNVLRYALTLSSGQVQASPLSTVRVILSGSTTYYLVAQGGFSVSTLSAYGSIYARRAR
jgi:hypothetical protein